MCGIFAYLGDRQAVGLLIAALKRLEYRGYDSAGVGIFGSPQLKIRKKVGKVTNLESECANAGEGLSGTAGIAHTRWATHGKPSDTNSHPHTTGDRSIAVVHNGIIENYRTVRESLTKKGYVFVSETDTELLAHLVQDFRITMPAKDYTWAQVVASALQLVEGAYGVVFLFQDEPDLLIGARKGSPLILGVGKGEYMLGSDACAIIEHTKDVVYLRDGELVELKRSGYHIKNIAQMVSDSFKADENNISNPIVRLEMSLGEIEKGGYKHFMLKEIMDQPNALRNAMRGRLVEKVGDDGKTSWQIKLGGLEKALDGDVDPSKDGVVAVSEGVAKTADSRNALERMSSAQRIIIVACGTSWHSGLIAKCAFESLAQLPVEVEYASEFRYRRPLLCQEDVIVAVSQSGETADTLEAVRIGQENKALTIGVVNGVGSSIARLTDSGVYLHAGPEIGVASTKAFTGQVITLLMVGLQLAFQRGALSQVEVDKNICALNSVPDLIEQWLEPLNEQVKIMAKYFRLATNVLFCGCGVHFPVALEGALKLKEISYIHAEGFPAAEIKHGPLTLVRGFIPVVVIAMSSDPAYKQIQANLKDLRSKDAALIVITDQGHNDFDNVASFVIHCPKTMPFLEALIAVVPLQLLSYHIADMRGCSIDQPRNLAKSVTVE